MQKNNLIRILKEEDYLLFEKIYRCFEGKPFWEAWTDEMIVAVFEEFLTTGLVFCYDNKGIMDIQYNQKKSDTLPYDDWGNFIYLSDIAVLEEYRCQGIGTILLDYLIDFGYINNFDTIYFRTNLEGSMVANLGLQKGFEVVRDTSGEIITEKVSFPRNRLDVPDTDIRQYLCKTLIKE